VDLKIDRHVTTSVPSHQTISACWSSLARACARRHDVDAREAFRRIGRFELALMAELHVWA
jgi:hypothetical protein